MKHKKKYQKNQQQNKFTYKTIDNVISDENKVYDITNECQYRVEPKYNGGHFYQIFAEQKTCWYSVGLYIDGEFKMYGKSPYTVKFEDKIMKVYRKGPIPY